MAATLYSLILASIIAISGVNAADAEDPFDLSFYTKGAAIGDSYSAGIGAGNRVDTGCSRYDGSYSNLVATRLGVPDDGLDFTYTACSGAVVKEITQQAKELASDQQFIILSAGGNDADLVGILNSCVFSFKGLFSHKNCEKILEESLATIESDDFHSSLDGLLDLAKSKLSDDGKIYYAGYGKFFDTTDNGCDKVSWHVWVDLFTKEYLTQKRRQGMNDLVDAMNEALRSAVERAGSQVEFIDYDPYIDAFGGRYCQPGYDESGGKSADLPYAFFYEMETGRDDSRIHDELRRRQVDENDLGIDAVNSTLGALYGAMIQEAIDEASEDATTDDYAALEDGNASVDLEAQVEDEVDEADGNTPSRIRVRSVGRHIGHEKFHHRSIRSLGSRDSKSPTSNLTMADSATVSTSNKAIHILGSKVTHAEKPVSSESSLGLSSVNTVGRFTNSNTNSSSSTGTVIANSTHLLLSGHKIVSRARVTKLFVSDMTARVFHPTQLGHSFIANQILYQMSVDNAKRNGIDDIPSMTMGDISDDIAGAACNTDASATWANRDVMIDAINEFCADPKNMEARSGSTTSAIFGADSPDYMNLSISWNNDNNVGEHECYAWLDTVTDACNTETGGDKHGGAIQYTSQSADATFKIEPLVVKKVWNGYVDGQGDGQQCNGIDTNDYMAQDILSANIDDFCKQSALQPQGIAESGSTFSQIFNDGRPDRVEISTEWPTGPRNYEIFYDECTYFLNVVSNGCSIPNDDNTMNWKHGGSVTDANDIKYTITPTEERGPPPSSPRGTCKKTNKLVLMAYEIHGRGWSRGDTEKALKDELGGCGALTKPRFEYTLGDDDQMEFKATGQLPTWMAPGCFGRAVKSAGGSCSED